jgi:hypothetical protein
LTRPFRVAVVPVIELTGLVVAVGDPSTAIVNSFNVKSLVLSETLIVKVKLPALVGVPERTPAAGFRFRPGGSDPAVTSHVYG